MPVITMASSKGGPGKTTSAVLLAGELARQGQEKGILVSLIDADPNQHLAKWAKKKPIGNIRIIENVDEENIIDVIDEEREKSTFVIVDSEGTASMAVANAISRSDLVIVPCQDSQDDADEAVKTVKLIKNQGRVLGRDISYSILFTRTNAAITTRLYKDIRQGFSEAGVSLFETTLIDRIPFRAVRTYGGTVNELNPKFVSGIPQAEANVKAFANEVKKKLLNKG